MSLFNIKNRSLFFFLLFIYISQSYSYKNNYFIFELRKYVNNSLNYDEPSNLIKYDLYSLYYTYLILGSHEKKYITQISLDGYGFGLTNYKCEIETNYTDNFFDLYDSDTSIIEISGVNFTYYGLNTIYRITDNIKLNQNNTLNVISPNIIFYFDPRNYSCAKKRSDFYPFTCFIFGLRLPSENYYSYQDYDINIIGQLYRKKIINSYEWFIEYNNESNAKLIIGISPYEYDKNKYSYNNSRSINSIYIPGIYYYWNIEFSQIYFIKNNKRKLIDYRKASLEPSLNYIKAPFDYFKFINETVIDDFIYRNKCFVKNVRKDINVYSIYYCENKEAIKSEIKNKFVNINFLHRFFEKEFILTYDDLFIEKNNKIYFLIIYDNMVRTNWILGKPFLKKYFFSYNYDNKIITFYETEKNSIYNNENKKNDTNDKTFIYILIILLLIILFSFLGFYFAKFIYSLNKRNATELFDVNDEYRDEDKKIIEPIFDNN